MGNQLGIAIANARLYETQLRENEKLNALVDISGGVSQRLELDPLLERILTRSAKIAGCRCRFHCPSRGRSGGDRGRHGRV